MSGEKFEIVGEAETGKEAIEKIKALRPDVALLDISLPGCTGIEVISDCKGDGSCATNFLIITMFDTKEYFYRAIKVGALGVINKNVAKHELFKGVTEVHAGNRYFGEKISLSEVEEIISRLDAEKFEENDPEKVYLTDREIEILHFLHDGLLSKQIAEKLSISTRTVDIHRGNLMQKFAVTNITELFAKVDTSEKLRRKIVAGLTNPEKL
jgi:DNA-binding NarL/FixJ family response regulator